MIVASNILSRMKGLMFSAKLPDCDGFLISPCNSIHTFFMLYPLDIVFMDKDFKIVKVLYNLNPWRMTWIYFSSHQVLEMKAGTLKKNLNQGDTLEAICIS
ncbi:MAG: DUF192 domain-containing protein [Bacteriovorax sp.]|nr:DUF192 domain-containing protein [Bacteriovorax sp.]